MASLYKRERSRFWWIEYVDAAGVRRQESTKLRYDLTSESRQAQELRRELTERELTKPVLAEFWESWVPRFIEQRYSNAPKTLQRYENSWRNVRAFMRCHQIHTPRQLSRQQVRDFIDWRTAPSKKIANQRRELGVRRCVKNNALGEIKLLRILMHEAVQSGFATTNPCERLGIQRDTPAPKPRITATEHRLILRKLRNEPAWMQISYEIAWEQGCRFSETCLPLSDVDLARSVIRFRTKGEKDSLAEFPLSSKLRPLFHRLKEQGRKVTFTMPEMPSKAWWRFFRRIGLRHLCFHCTRVTFITRCYERGIPRDVVMRLAGHTSTAAHEIYPRLPASSHLLQQMRKLL